MHLEPSKYQYQYKNNMSYSEFYDILNIKHDKDLFSSIFIFTKFIQFFQSIFLFIFLPNPYTWK